MKRTYSKPAFKKVKLDAAVLLSKGCKSAEHHGRALPAMPGSPAAKDPDPFGKSCKANGYFVRNHEHGS